MEQSVRVLFQKQIFDQAAPTTIKVVVPTEPNPVNTNRLRLLIFLSVVALLVIALFPVVVFRLAFISSLVNPFHDYQATVGSTLPTTPPHVPLSSTPSITARQETRLGLVARLVQASRQPLSTSTRTWPSSTRRADGSTLTPAGISSPAAAITDRVGTSGKPTETQRTLLVHSGAQAFARTH
ncbi:uncharacterized protein LOC113214847 isoform X2 [Frankliniella occidentalis]|uniref:Uncharacterized protein LOC113214847 isoform X2 n=1 Tax=Frankliniella occidentalis TaxID=133901 RepID=A0A9C6X793_FRAOC|nr:uncharacterized protein LOC113214847 isoform X2 [Frankliniella occidentalis]